MASNAENVSIWWRHHDFSKLCSISHQFFPIFLKMTVYQNQYCSIIYTERLHVLWFNTVCEIRLKSTQYRYLKKKCCVYACQQPINITNTVVAPNLLLLIHIRVTICQMRVDKYLHDKGSKKYLWYPQNAYMLSEFFAIVVEHLASCHATKIQEIEKLIYKYNHVNILHQGTLLLT